MSSFTKREQIVILVIVLIVVISLSFKFILKDIIKSEPTIIEQTNSDNFLEYDKIEEPESKEESIIMVHISGQIYKPGLVELESGKRLKDAVELAGGLKKDADLDKINLAKKLSDEEKIYIPKIGEELSEEFQSIVTESTTGDNLKDSSKVDINNCNKEALLSLPGIGDVIAGRIIDYREINKFKTIEDIKSVSGIGDKKFEGIKELITVN
jgi:competence protein ComEA